MKLQALEHAGKISKVIAEGDHGAWTVTIIWGGYEPFRGQGLTLGDAYRRAINAIVMRANEHRQPGVHDLGRELMLGNFDR